MTDQTYSFAEFELDTSMRRLLKGGQVVALNPKAFDLLLTLVERRGDILSKNELLDSVWEGQFVEENNLTVQVSALRKALGETKNEHHFIVTVPGKGYKFAAEVDTPTEDETEIVIERHTISRVLIDEEIGKSLTKNVTPVEFQSTIGNRFPGHKLAVTAFTIFFVVATTVVIGVFGYWVLKDENQSDNRELNLSKLTTSGKITNATITPDGKYAVYSQTENDGESLWLRHIVSGSQQQILPSKPVRFVGLAVSPDGNSIYATTFSANIADPQIWRIPLLGGATETFKDIWTGVAVSFSPDGKKIAFTESHTSIKETELHIADADGSNKSTIARAADDERSFPNFAANPVAWSPDGAEIACAVEEKNTEGGIRAGILLVDPKSGSERQISDRRWDYIENLTWTDAENLAFIAFSNETRQGQIWSISKISGKATQITKDLHSYSWLASAGGELLTVQENKVSHLLISEFDEKKDQVAPREIYRESGFIDNAAFAADGSVLYSSFASGKHEIWRVHADGAKPIQLTTNSDISFGFSISPVDGSIVFCSAENGKHTLKLADSEGKNVRSLTEGTEDVFPDFAADGRTVIFQRGLNNKMITLWKVSIDDQTPVQLTKTHSTHPAVSIDGTQTAYYFMDAETDGLWRIGLVSSVDGSYLGKLTFPKAVTNQRMRWHPNGRFIGQIVYEGENINLLLLPINGGNSSTVSGLGKGEVNWFDWSHDGKQLIISRSTATRDVVLLSK